MIDELQNILNVVFATYTRRRWERDVAFPEINEVATLLLMPSGWGSVMQVEFGPTTPPYLAGRTRQFASIGLDVTWWLSGAAQTDENARWLAEHTDMCYLFDATDDQIKLQMWGEDRGREWTFDMLSQPKPAQGFDRLTTRWLRTALVRLVELQGTISSMTWIRAIDMQFTPAGQPPAQHWLGGMLGALNNARAIRKLPDGSWRAVKMAAICPDVPRLPAVGIAAARARASRHEQ